VSPSRLADVVLADRLLGVTGSIPAVRLDPKLPRIGRFADAPGGPSPSRYGEGALLALETLGLLSSDEAAEWRRRLAVAREGWHAGEPAAGERAERAAGHLGAALDELEGAAGTPARAASLERFQGAFALCLQTGLVSPSDAAEWGERLERALGKTLEDFAWEQAGLEPDDDWYVGEATRIDHGPLLRLVPALPARHNGLCVTALALHENGFRVHWHALRDGPDADEEFGPQAAVDDLGTQYEEILADGCGWAGYDGVVAITGESRCMTPVPDRATQLTLRKADAEWIVPLQTPSATSSDSP
jgi:hypothetical protein